jgi:hypothetical protein
MKGKRLVDTVTSQCINRQENISIHNSIGRMKVTNVRFVFLDQSLTIPIEWRITYGQNGYQSTIFLPFISYHWDNPSFPSATWFLGYSRSLVTTIICSNVTLDITDYLSPVGCPLVYLLSDLIFSFPFLYSVLWKLCSPSHLLPHFKW